MIYIYGHFFIKEIFISLSAKLQGQQIYLEKSAIQGRLELPSKIRESKW